MQNKYETTRYHRCKKNSIVKKRRRTFVSILIISLYTLSFGMNQCLANLRHLNLGVLNSDFVGLQNGQVIVYRDGRELQQIIDDSKEKELNPLNNSSNSMNKQQTNTINQLQSVVKNEPDDTTHKEDPLLTLVNPTNFIPDDWVVDLVKLGNGQAIDRSANKDLQQMLKDAKALKLRPVICSSYRTNEKQTELFNRKVAAYKKQGYSEKEAKKKAGYWVAVPGTSEHQLGLAVDIVSEANRNLNESQEKTALQKWLIKNCWKYGYILRYPTNKSKITGIGYEPWHYRYVGKEAAKAVTEQGICLEEYKKLQLISSKNRVVKNALNK